ncbi:sensor histidine kinase [Nonomuraea rhizosphaerae]|uniref:sensor histidine kinase n=1 Tax=Nonomuraea rhizosphaerae TaxID=2665663 RepID=UPI001C602659|nr:histidine kinase [Nonomuraea rhizosphaerae]
MLIRVQDQLATGLSFVIAGFAFSTTGVDVLGGPFPYVSMLASGVYTFPLGYGVLKYRNKRLTREHKVWLAVAFFFIVVGTVGQGFLARPEWNKYLPGAWWPTLHADPDLYQVVAFVLGAGWCGTAVWMCRIQLRRVANENSFERKALLPFAIGSVVLAVLTAVISTTLMLSPSFTNYHAYALLGLIMTVLLLSLLASLVARLLLQSRLLHDLPYLATPSAVVDYLRQALDDQTLEVFYWDPPANAYVGPDGRPCTVRSRSGDSREFVTSGAGEPVAVIVGHPAVLRNWRRMDEVRSVAYGIIANAQSQASLQARVADLAASRQELVHERELAARSLSRDLHDGVQQTLYAARIDVMSLQAAVQPGPVADGLGTVCEKIDKAIDQIRATTRGYRPAELTGGLRSAVANIADQLNMRVALDIRDMDLGRLEEVLYYTTKELLLNIFKHASAQSVRVQLAKFGDLLVLEVTDNGVGTADPAGAGIAGVRLRIEDSGGIFEMSSAAGEGTRVVARWDFA